MYANIIVDISHEKLDKEFQYKIPESMTGRLDIGMQVYIPFGMGNRKMKGYVVGFSLTTDYDPEKIKEVDSIAEEGVSITSHLIKLAWWMKERYGCTMNQALKTVIPVKQKVQSRQKRYVHCLLEGKALRDAIKEAENKHYAARQRLLEALLDKDMVPMDLLSGKLNISLSTVKSLEKAGVLSLVSETVYRNPVKQYEERDTRVALNQEQNYIVNTVNQAFDAGGRDTFLIHGVTGSGKTEVYMAMIAHVLEAKKQAIVLIPEIALTYQTVMRFYERFGTEVSIINSRLSAGERYDQFLRAQNGEVQIMIGPRSALFTPFPNLGLIIIDEEHEGAYQSEITPRYHARDVAAKRAGMTGANLVLGSATPSVETYYRALRGEYKLCTLNHRAGKNSTFAQVSVVDLREELKAGNKSIFSRQLAELMEDRLSKKEQMMLFLNRRGYSGFISCRSCGTVVKCPHCDVSLTAHKDGRMVCHYCGYEQPVPKLCPVCGSPYIAGFGIGTQKVEAMVKKQFPAARVLRMDLDTTSGKDGHEKILSQFADGEADILIGTQMIVKGHDFSRVTLVGVLAADLSLNSSDYRSAERTFQLLTQAAGRAGRGELSGQAVIQTYNPEHYSITAAAKQDYNAFYQQEIQYRSLLKYPPVCSMLSIMIASRDEEDAGRAAAELADRIQKKYGDRGLSLIGPGDAQIFKMNDIFRKMLYVKMEEFDLLLTVRDDADAWAKEREGPVTMQYDF